MLRIELDRDNTLALYKQIAEQIKTQISTGRLPAGTRLPTVRELAEELGVTRLTVQNAYSEIQADGWTEATVGRGTFVSEAVQPDRVGRIGRRMTPDGVIEDIVQMSQVVGVRSLAAASPDPGLFAADEFFTVLHNQRHDADDVLQYGPTAGDSGLRVALAALLNEWQIDVMPDDVIVTAGVTQGLSLAAQALARPGDTVLIEQPTYLGVFNVLRAQGLTPIPVPLDDEGPRIDLLERLARRHQPQFFYTIPTFHNPTGLCTTAERRCDVLELANALDFFVIEDDIYRWLAYDEPAPAALKALDAHGIVIYVNSFSKVFMPGLRLGFVVAPLPIRDRMLTLRRAADLGGIPLVQRAMAAFLRNDRMKRHLQRALPVYARRRDTILEALETYMPQDVTWSRPAGGFCLWVTLPQHVELSALYETALQRGLLFTPGDVFMVHPDARSHLRLCFGMQTTDGLRSGVQLLAQLIDEHIDVLRAQHPRPHRESRPLV